MIDRVSIHPNTTRINAEPSASWILYDKIYNIYYSQKKYRAYDNSHGNYNIKSKSDHLA